METERLIIDSFKPEDKFDYFLNITNDKRVLATFMCRYTEKVDDLNFDFYLNSKDVFAIRLKETKKVIGVILICVDEGDSCEIGYAIGVKYWNQGYTTEATKRFISYCLKEREYKQVTSSYFDGNEASKRVMEKCGMIFDHYNKDEFVYLGESKSLSYYKISN